MNYDYYQVYATMKRLPAGHIHKKNVDGDISKAYDVALNTLSPHGMSDFELVEKSEPDQDFVTGPVDVNFLYNSHTFLDHTVVGDMPAILIYPDASNGVPQPGIGIGFGDIEIMECFLDKLLRAYAFMKEPKIAKDGGASSC